MDLTTLPALPAGLRWDVRTFENNEIQWYTPGSRVELRVVRDRKVLGIRFSTKDYTYPTYVVPVDRGEAYLAETAALIVQRHQAYLVNRGLTEQLVTSAR